MIDAVGSSSGTGVALRGRLEPDELAFLWHIRSRLQVGSLVRLLVFSMLVFLVGGLGLAMYLSSLVRHVVPAGHIVGFLLALAALFDVSGLSLMRHRIMVRILRPRRPEAAVQLDNDGVRSAPVGRETSHTSFGWPLLDVLALSEGIVIAVRKPPVPILFFPKRVLSDASSDAIIALAHAHGAQVLDGPRGRPIPASSGDVSS